MIRYNKNKQADYGMWRSAAGTYSKVKLEGGNVRESSTDLHMQDYKSVMIWATLVNTHTHTHKHYDSAMLTILQKLQIIVFWQTFNSLTHSSVLIAASFYSTCYTSKLWFLTRFYSARQSWDISLHCTQQTPPAHVLFTSRDLPNK